MRNGKRNWLLALLVCGVIIFGLGWLSNRQTPEASAAVDTRTPIEKFVSAYSQYTQAQIDRFQRYMDVVRQENSNDFWTTMFYIAVASSVVLSAYFGWGAASALIDRLKNKANIVTTPYGVYYIEKTGDGRRVPRPIDKPFEESAKQESVKTLPVTHNGETQVIEVKEGKVIDVVEDAADFLKKAIRVNGHSSVELPRHESMGVSAEKWSSMVHEVLGGLFTVENRGGGVRTYCAAYPDLASTLFAIRNKEVPLPEKKKAKK